MKSINAIATVLTAPKQTTLKYRQDCTQASSALVLSTHNQDHNNNKLVDSLKTLLNTLRAFAITEDISGPHHHRPL